MALWKCPLLNDAAGTSAVEFTSVLSGINLEKFEYQCTYSYANQNKVATTCQYLSESFKRLIGLKKTYLRGSVLKFANGKLEQGKGHIRLVAESNTSKYLDFNNEFDITSNYIVTPPSLENKITALSIEADQVLYSFGALWNRVLGGNVNGFYFRLAGSSKIDDMMETSYKELVQPYVVSNNTRETKTFSRFVAGLVTLDPDVIVGYNEANCTAKLNSDWGGVPNNASQWEQLKEWWDRLKNNSDMSNPDLEKMNSWIDIFNEKVWAFYYNLQRRLDIGYSIIASQLLFLMMAFFAMGATARGSAKYITNRESGQSSGEVKINEQSIMKTLGILATVFVFYISVPGPITSEYKYTKDTEVTNEMRGNNSFIKQFIQYSMAKGSYFGTMMADLGTDSFLDYLIKNQGLFTGKNEYNTYASTLEKMIYYYPAYQIVNECEKNYGLSIDDMNQKHFSMTHDPVYHKRDFPKNNNITDIDIGLCQKMYEVAYSIFTKVNYETQRLSQTIDSDLITRLQATETIVYNHIELQKSLGWMNIIAVPYTYFMMREQDLFFTEVIDYKQIQKKANKFTDKLGIRRVSDSQLPQSLKNIISGGNGQIGVTSSDDGTMEILANSEILHKYAIYNYLPFFSGIKSQISQKISAIYSDSLRAKRSGGTIDYKSFKALLKVLVDKGKKYYSDGPSSVEDLNERIDNLLDDTTINAVKLHMLTEEISYISAMGMWKYGFTMVFLSSIALVIGMRIVMYVIYVLIHFFISPFVVLWAFATSEEGMKKVKDYLRDTLVYMMYPSIIVLSVFIFIFAYELFYSVYGFILAVLSEGQIEAIKAASLARGIDNAEVAKHYLAVSTLQEITEILIDLLSVYVAFIVMNKLPELVLKALGLSESSATFISQSTEKALSQGGNNVSPLAK